MPNHSLYRKYRPQTFSDVVGQEHIEQTLRNALANDRVSHAYLFCGPRGTGKTTTARLLAKALLCDKAPTANPDGVCANCVDIAEGTHPDVYELDAASRTGVDNVREEIIGRVAFSPTRGRYKVYIIDEVHMLSIAAFNALLKTLEEPPAHVVFVLCTTDPQKVPDTIVSRCQRFDFHSLTTEQITSCLEQICDGEGFKYESDALELIAKQAKGGMRDAITALEQVAVFGNGNVNYASAENMFGDVSTVEISEVIDLIIARDVAGCFGWVDSFAATGIDVVQVARSMTSYVRNLYVASLDGGQRALPPLGQDATANLLRQAKSLGTSDRIASMLMVLGDLMTELRTAVDARLSLEIALTRLAHPSGELTLEALAGRIDALEAGGSVQPQPTTSPSPRPQTTPAGGQRTTDDSAPTEPTPMGSSTTRPTPEPEPQPEPEPEPEPAEQPDSSSNQESVSIEEAARRAAGLLKDPSSLRRLWDIAVRNLGKEHPAAPGLLGGAKPHADLKNSRIVVELPHDAIFAKGTLSKPDTMNDMLLELQRVFGVKIGLTYELGEAAGAADTAGSEVISTSDDATTGFQQQPQPAQERNDFDDDVPVDAYEGIDASEAATPSATDETPQSAGASQDEDPEMSQMFKDVFGDGIVIKEKED